MLVGILIIGADIRAGGLANALSEMLYNTETPDRMQGVLHAVTRRDKVINDLLNDILKESRTAARARLAIIHNTSVGLSLAPLMHYDITHAVTREGFSPGPMTVNGAVGQWTFLLVMEDGKCVANSLNEMSPTERFNLEAMGAAYRLICPAADYSGHLLGVVFITWAAGTPMPTADDLKHLQEVTLDHGRQMAAAINAASY